MEPVIGPIIEYIEKSQTYPIGIVLVYGPIEHADYRYKCLQIVKVFSSQREVEKFFSNKRSILRLYKNLDEIGPYIDDINKHELLEIWDKIAKNTTNINDLIKNKELSTLFDAINNYLKETLFSSYFEIFYGKQSLEAVTRISNIVYNFS